MVFGENNMLKKMKLLFLTALIVCSCVFCISCQTKQEIFTVTLTQCQKLLDKDDIINAKDCYAKVVADNPDNNAEILQVRINSFYDKCVELLERERKYVKAATCFEELSVLLPKKQDVYTYLAEAYYKQNEIQNKEDLIAQAEDAIKKAIRLDDKSAIAHSTYAKILERKGDVQNALIQYNMAVNLEPKDTLYLIKLALFQDKIGDLSSALESYQRALEIDPNDTVTLHFLSVLYEKMGKIDEAIETIEKRIKIEPAEQETLERLKRLKRQQNKKSKAKSAGSN